MEKKIRVYVVGNSYSYARWIDNHIIVQDMALADLVLFTGGEDVNPFLYGEQVGNQTYFDSDRDNFEMAEYKKASKLRLPMWGTCRGLQFLCVMAGGKLIQDMNHPYTHNVTFYDGKIVKTNSIHHQMIFPYTMYKDNYKIVAYSLSLSNKYLNGFNNPMIVPTDESNRCIEVESAFFPKIRAFGQQSHPELLDNSSDFVKINNALLRQFLNNRLDIILELEIPIDRVMEKDFRIHQDEFMLYSEIKQEQAKRKLQLLKESTKDKINADAQLVKEFKREFTIIKEEEVYAKK